MDVTPLIPAGRQIVQSYGEDGFRISGTLYRHAVIVRPEQTVPWDFTGDAAGLSSKDFEIFSPGALDVVLLGCGKRQVFLPAAVRGELRRMGINVETMDTGAACRTYNTLMADGRRVAAALLPPVE